MLRQFISIIGSMGTKVVTNHFTRNASTLLCKFTAFPQKRVGNTCEMCGKNKGNLFLYGHAFLIHFPKSSSILGTNFACYINALLGNFTNILWWWFLKEFKRMSLQVHRRTVPRECPIAAPRPGHTWHARYAPDHDLGAHATSTPDNLDALRCDTARSDPAQPSCLW